jgi:transcriptional regulator with XRE-family HTH domain
MPSDRVAKTLEYLAANVRRYRTRVGLTQEQLAERSELDLSYLQRIERAEGNATVSTLVALTDALGIKIGALFREAKLQPTRPGRPPKKRKAKKQGTLTKPSRQ